MEDDSLSEWSLKFFPKCRKRLLNETKCQKSDILHNSMHHPAEGKIQAQIKCIFLVPLNKKIKLKKHFFFKFWVIMISFI